ncbi:MAG: TetR/AcrR family transcriptional regulator [Burkholderiales bacterium]|nr:TetR/AcrR family transcriptional regulator [Burkholderiales bacterium]
MALRNAGARSTAASDTKTRILDAAEELFVEVGYDGMSLRQITSAAEVNLAAVNYHFGGKDLLTHAMLARRLDRLNVERIAMLDAFQAAHGARITTEHVLIAMFAPALRMSHADATGGRRFLRFLGRAYTDVSPVVQGFIATHYTVTLSRFFTAFQQTLPHLPREELGFRLHFAMGALSSILAGSNPNRLLQDFTQGHAENELLILGRLASLMVAALRAPLPGPGELSALGGLLVDAAAGAEGREPAAEPAVAAPQAASPVSAAHPTGAGRWQTRQTVG